MSVQNGSTLSELWGEEKPKVYGDLTKLPAQLAPLLKEHRWVVWRLEPRPDGGFNKPLYQSRFPWTHASSTNESTWSSYSDAMRTVQQGDATGIGYCLHKSGISAFDLDDCRDPNTGAIDAWAAELVKDCDSYAEVTVSGTGLRVLGTGAGDRVHRKSKILGTAHGSIEIYRQAERYITI